MSAKQHKPLDSTKLENIFETNNTLRDIVPDKIKNHSHIIARVICCFDRKLREITRAEPSRAYLSTR